MVGLSNQIHYIYAYSFFKLVGVLIKTLPSIINPLLVIRNAQVHSHTLGQIELNKSNQTELVLGQVN